MSGKTEPEAMVPVSMVLQVLQTSETRYTQLLQSMNQLSENQARMVETQGSIAQALKGLATVLENATAKLYEARSALPSPLPPLASEPSRRRPVTEETESPSHKLIKMEVPS